MYVFLKNIISCYVIDIKAEEYFKWILGKIVELVSSLNVTFLALYSSAFSS